MSGNCFYSVAFDKLDDGMLRTSVSPTKAKTLEFLFASMSNRIHMKTCRIQNPDIPQAGRVGAPGGAAGRALARLSSNKIIRPRNKKFTVPSKASKKCRLASLQKHEQAKSYVNRQRNKISGRPAVYHRCITGLSAGREARFVPGCRPVERRLFVFVNLFHARHVREQAKEQNTRLTSALETVYEPVIRVFKWFINWMKSHLHSGNAD